VFYIDVDCREPENLEHGKYTLASNATYYGAAVLYECDSNYELDGHGRRLCLDNGTWSSETPQCKGTSKIHFYMKNASKIPINLITDRI
jgi:hypothetical protein